MLPPEPIVDTDGRQYTSPVPSLSILHVLLWVVATAVLLAIYITEDIAFGRSVPAIGPWTTYILHAINATIYGAVLIAAILLLRYSRSTGIDHLQPGHWLVFNSAVIGLLSMFLSFLWRCFAPEPVRKELMILDGSVCSLVSFAMYWFASKRLLETDRWKGAFLIFAMAHLLAALESIALAFSPPAHFNWALLGLLWMFLLFVTVAFTIVAFFSFLSAFAGDLYSKCRRDWLHWLGIAAVVALTLNSTAWLIAGWFSLP